MTATPSARPAPFSYATIWWLGFGFLGVQLVFTHYNAFLPILYREHLDSLALIGLLMGTDNLIGLLLIPFIGAWSDRVNSPHGRRLPFIRAALPVAALSFFAIPWAAPLLWLLILTEVVFTAAMHAYRGPLISLMPDHTPPQKRSQANGIVNLMGGLGSLIALGGLSLLYDLSPQASFGLGSLLLLVSLAVVWRRAERQPPHVDREVLEGSAIAGALGGLRGILKPARRGELLVLSAMLTYFVGFAGLDAMFPIYGVEVLGLTPGRAAFILTAFAGAFLVFALLAGYLGNRLGKIRAMQIGLFLVPLLFLAAIPLRDPNLIAALFVAAGFAWALVNVQALPLIADLGGRQRIGFYVGLYYIFTMTGQMLGPAALGGLMDLIGYSGLFIGGAAFYALGLLLLTLGQRRLAA